MLVDVAASSSARSASVAASSSGESGISCTAGAGWPISTSSREGHDSSRSLAGLLARERGRARLVEPRDEPVPSVPGVATACRADRSEFSDRRERRRSVRRRRHGGGAPRPGPWKTSRRHHRDAEQVGERRRVRARVSSSSGGRVGFSARGERANAAKRRPSDWAA